MKMRNFDTNTAVKTFARISDSVIRKSGKTLPIVTKSGILIGSYIIKPVNHCFLVQRGSEVLYRTFNKTAAMIIANLLHNNNRDEIVHILDVDRKVASAREDLEVSRYHYNKAKKNNDHLKSGIMISKFEAADDKYQIAKHKLQESYSKLF